MSDAGATPTTEFDFLAADAHRVGATTPLPTVTRRVLRLPDHRELSALEWGAGGTRTFLHGVGLNAHTWDASLLALDGPALAIDLAGHGRSSWRPDADYAPDVLAEDVVRALDAWTTAPQTLVGHSLGGLTALAVAARRPDLVSSVVLVDITPGIDLTAGPAALRSFFDGPADWATHDELVDRAIAFGLGDDRDALRRGVTLNTRVREDGRVEWAHHFARLAADDPGALATLIGPAPWSALAQVEHPVHLIRGSRGFVTEADARVLQERHPGTSVTTLDAGHNIQEEVPVALAEAIRTLDPAPGRSR